MSIHENEPVRVLVAESSEIVRSAIVAEVGTLDGIEIVEWASNTNEALEQARALRPDVVIMAAHLADGDAFDLYSSVRTEMPSVDALMFDTAFRIGPINPAASTEELVSIASYIVATHLVPKVRALHPRVYAVSN